MTKTTGKLALCLALALILIPQGYAQAQSGVTYVYDDLGRLVGVIDPVTRNAAAYSYDAVGNLASIKQYTRSDLWILGFTPTSGPVGTSVTILGTGFSPTPSENTVKFFNGIVATVTSANVNQIVATVPTGATNGSISVRTPTAGPVTSSTPFTVTTAGGSPTITVFTPPKGTPGTTVTVNGTNFDVLPSNDKTTINITAAFVSSATPTTLSTVVPTATASGHISLSTPAGKAVSSQDFFIPFGAHVADDIGYTGRTTSGVAQPVSIPANKIGLLLFDATGGQKASVQMSGSTFSSCTLYIFAPDARQLASSDCTTTSFLDPAYLPLTGTYTIGIDPGATTGTISVTPNTFFDVAGPINMDGPAVPVETKVPGQDVRLTFTTTTANQRVFVTVTNVSNPGAWLSILNAYGTLQTFRYLINPPSCNPSCDIGTQTLMTPGAYTLWVQHSGTNIGSETLKLTSVPADLTGAISIDGPTVPLTTVPGQDARLTFTTTSANQRVVLFVTSVSNPVAFVKLVLPDGITIQAYIQIGLACNPCFMDTQKLQNPAGTTYTLWVQHNGANSGSETLQLKSVPDDVSTVISIDGPAVTVETTAAGQDARLTFTTTKDNQQVVPRVTYATNPGAWLILVKPDGSTIQASIWITPNCTISNPCSMGTQLLQSPAGTTYTLWVKHYSINFGKVTASVTSP